MSETKDKVTPRPTMDWQQAVLNSGPPCFFIAEDGRYCGRAERWQGHHVAPKHTSHVFHKFVSLDSLIGKFTDALKQCRTLISTLKHLDSLDRMSLDAAVDLTMHKIDSALAKERQQ